ncbi:MAG: nicotinamide riboside transporter PnuC [Bacteroidota bacterium]|nr:nicotinamide riboside transporter PnuC [Bacteroidota bacterium]
MKTASWPDVFLGAVGAASAIEWFAIITALIYVILAAKESAWCWLFGIISAGLYIYINFVAKLYLDSWLSFYYCVIGIYGWYVWVKKIPEKNSGRSVSYISLRVFCISLAAGLGGTFLLGYLSDRFTDSPLPYFDAALTSFSLVATFLTTQKILENWLFWVVIDAAYIFIYWNRSLPFTAALFLIYTFIAAYGYFKWRKKLKAFAA